MECPVTMIQKIEYSRQVQEHDKHYFCELFTCRCVLFVPHLVLTITVT